MNRKVSLKDIAREAGVSTALVSYVLNNLKEGRIRKEVSQRIRDVARRLNYRPNHLARSLKTRKTFTLGLVVADISNPFSSSLARIIEDEADRMQYTVIFGSSDENPDKFSKLVNTFLDRQVDGLILSPPEGSESQVEELLNSNVPFVLLDRYFPDLKTSYVVLDNFNAARVATTHLVQAGRRRIGFIGYSTSLLHLKEREQGFVAALKECGLKPVKSLMKRVQVAFNEKEIAQALNELLLQDPAPDALLFCSNIIGAICLRIINRSKWKVPDHLMIACFDETRALNLFYAPLTFIRQPLDQLGQTATRILISNLGEEKNVVQVKMEAEIIAPSSQRADDRSGSNV